MITAGTKRARLAVVAAAVVVGSVAVWATAPLGFLVNQTLAVGLISGGLSQHMRPRPRHDLDNLVAAAPGEQPAAARDLVREHVDGRVSGPLGLWSRQISRSQFDGSRF